MVGPVEDPYRLLGVNRAAGPAAIRAAYLALMRAHHPDRAGGSADPAQAQRIAAAYHILGDVQRRAAFDWETHASGLRIEPATPGTIRRQTMGRRGFLLVLIMAAVICGWALTRDRPQVPTGWSRVAD